MSDTPARNQWKLRPRIVIAAVLLQGCASTSESEPFLSDASPAPVASASEDRALPLQLTHRSGIEILFASEAEREGAREILVQSVRLTEALGQYLGESVPPFEIRLTDAVRVPYASRGVLNLPADRLDQLDPQWKADPFSIGHEMVHLIGRGNRSDRLLAEGLAVYLNDKFAPPTYPNHGKALDPLLKTLETETGRIIPLLDSEKVRRGRETRELRQQAYVQEGSFVQWYVEKYGLDRFSKLLLDKRPFDADGTDWAALEAEWRRSLL